MQCKSNQRQKETIVIKSWTVALVLLTLFPRLLSPSHLILQSLCRWCSEAGHTHTLHQSEISDCPPHHCLRRWFVEVSFRMKVWEIVLMVSSLVLEDCRAVTFEPRCTFQWKHRKTGSRWKTFFEQNCYWWHSLQPWQSFLGRQHHQWCGRCSPRGREFCFRNCGRQDNHGVDVSWTWQSLWQLLFQAQRMLLLHDRCPGKVWARQVWDQRCWPHDPTCSQSFCWDPRQGRVQTWQSWDSCSSSTVCPWCASIRSWQ